MERNMTAEDKFKRRMKIICFIPAVVFFITGIYCLVLLLPLTQGHPMPERVIGITSRNYNSLLFLLATFSTVSAIALIFCMVHLIKLKALNTPRKMEWVLLLLATPVSFILFWYFIVKPEPDNVPLYSDID